MSETKVTGGQVECEWASFNRFEFQLPVECVNACHHTGACDSDVEFWQSRVNRPSEMTPEKLRAELSEYGAWNDYELSDDAANWRRIIWLAAGNIQDERNP